jgi:hypothetical protein
MQAKLPLGHTLRILPVWPQRMLTTLQPDLTALPCRSAGGGTRGRCDKVTVSFRELGCRKASSDALVELLSDSNTRLMATNNWTGYLSVFVVF